MQRDAILIAVLIVVVGIFGFFVSQRGPSSIAITTFEECVQHGNTVLGTDPRQCFADGKTFVEGQSAAVASNTGGQNTGSNAGVTYNRASSDLVEITLPFPGATTGSDFTVRGHAKPEWFVQGSFPIAVLDTNSTIIADGLATGNFSKVENGRVPFAGELVLPREYKGPAILVILMGAEGDIPEDHPYAVFPIQVEP